MYALPRQTLAHLRADLDVVLAFAPPHLSVYHLTIEPNTRFAHNPPARPDDDSAAVMLDCITERTAAAGLQRYEVSAYARRGHACRHNLNYWQFGDYLGIGAGAHGKLTLPHGVLRQQRVRDPARYMDAALGGNAVTQEHAIAERELAFEFMLNALRLREGFAPALFVERTGLSMGALEPGLTQAVQRGLLQRDALHIRPTAQGFDFLNDLQALFLPDSAPPS
jgi:oxygen-independent coproporphyrinogen-3 oxidase